MTLKARLTLILLMLFAFVQSINAEVVLDNTFNEPQSIVADLNGKLHIEARFGKQVNENLFHSFEKFSLLSGETALFKNSETQATIVNVINRVTGGELSDINGTIESEIGGANFYFINPAGIVFGKDARLDLGGGAFYASTADYLTLGLDKSGIFSAIDPENSILTSATPSAFGFLNEMPKQIVSKSEQLEAESIGLVGGNIFLENSILKAPSGEIMLVSLDTLHQNPLEINIDDEINVSDEHLGSIAIVNSREFAEANILVGGTVNANVDVTNKENTSLGGQILIVSSDINLVNSIINASNGINEQNTENFDKSGIIEIKAVNLTLENSFIASDNGGEVNIQLSGNLTMLNFPNDLTEFQQYISLSTSISSTLTGKASKIALLDIAAANIYMVNSLITAQTAPTNSSGDSGDISVRAENIRMKRQSSISTNTAPLDSNGSAGNIVIEAQNLNLAEGSSIGANQQNALSEKDAGKIEIKAGYIDLKNSFILANQFGLGKSGEIVLDIVKLEAIGGGIGGIRPTDTDNLSSDEAKGRGGNIEIKANTIDLSDMSLIDTGAPGATGGNVKITALDSLILNDSQINSDGSASGGDIIIVTSGKIHIINSTLDASAKGDGGNINILEQSPSNTVVILGNDTKLNASAELEAGGRINIRLDGYVKTPSAELNVEVASKLGVPGEIVIDNLNENIEEEMLLTETTFITDKEEVQDLCEVHTADFRSTFEENGGRGGVYHSPDDVIPPAFCE